MEHAPRDEHPPGVGEEHVGEDATFAVTGLPPRIGEVDVDRVEAGVGEEVADEDVAVAGDDPGVDGALPGEPSGGHLRVAVADLDPEKAAVRGGRGGGGEKQTLAAPHLELDWRTGKTARKELAGIEGRGSEARALPEVGILGENEEVGGKVEFGGGFLRGTPRHGSAAHRGPIARR